MRSFLFSRSWPRPPRPDPYAWLVVAFSLFAALPLAGPGYFFDAHDAPHTIFFLTEFDAALRDGVWYPGWATDQALGYGYPTFVFYSPLAYYVAEGFHLLGAGKVAAIKWTWALATVASGLAMYACGRHLLGRQRGWLAAVVYVYMPYHLADLYVRAALAEYCAFVWMPLALLAFHRLVEEPTARQVGLAGLAYGALLMTHHVTGLAFTPLLASFVLFCLLQAKTDRPGRLARAAAALAGALLGLGVAAALLLPAFGERQFINQEQWVRASYDYALHFLHPAHLLSAAWGYAPGRPGTPGGMSFQLGAVPFLLASAAVASAWHRPARERALVLFLGGATALLIFLMSPLSAFLWRLLPVAALIQFPWRLLALTAVTLALLSGERGIGVNIRRGRLEIAPGSRPPARTEASTPVNAWPHAPEVRLESLHLTPVGERGQRAKDQGLILVWGVVVLLASFPYTLPHNTPVPDMAEGPLLTIEFEMKYTDMRGMTAWTKEMPPDSPLVEQYRAGGPLVTAEALAPGATVEMIRAGGASDELWVRSPQGTALRFYTYYFPGWRVYVDGRRLADGELRPETVYGLLTVDIPPGEHHVLLRWGDTPLRLAGKALTLGCLLLAGGLVSIKATQVAPQGPAAGHPPAWMPPPAQADGR